MGIIWPSLWLNGNAEEAIPHHISIFPSSTLLGVTRCAEAGPGPAEIVVTTGFVLDIAAQRHEWENRA